MAEHGALRGQNPPGLASPSCGSETPGHGPSWQGAGSWQRQPFPGSPPQPRASPRQSAELQLAGAAGAARGTAKLPGGCLPPGSSSGPCLGPLPRPLPGVWGETEPGAAGRAGEAAPRLVSWHEPCRARGFVSIQLSQLRVLSVKASCSCSLPAPDCKPRSAAALPE